MSLSKTDRLSFSQQGLEAAGFDGFVDARQLRDSRLAAVPQLPGVYVVLRVADAAPDFLSISVGGRFKGSDPTVPTQVLRAKWVPGAHLLYVGKATAGSRGTNSLRTRLGSLLRYGAGQPVGHQGGRYLWQVKGADDYLYAWCVSSDPTVEENHLMTDFLTAYGAYPFANIAGPRW